ncbi:uncharacterized protein LOC124819255 [Hydra vulgaris]|uniref:uncharacterized protein LOC124819255 n=1 Tax=Hydra vulgaris TaxID=6087 RepID=UPI001F5E8691|nr:uncharacterized protein LOC124819255 isoform X2 [Hydra vulgaris]
MHVEVMFKIMVVTTVIQFTGQNKVIDMIEEITKSLNSVSEENRELTYGNKFGGNIEQSDEAVAATPKTYIKINPEVEGNQPSPTFNTDYYRDKWILSKLVSLLENYIPNKIQKDEESKNAEEVKTKDFDRFLAEFEKEDKNFMPSSSKNNEMLLHPENWENLLKTIRQQIQSKTLKYRKKETPDKAEWIPWILKNKLHDNIWKDISAIEEEYKKKQKDQQKNVILKRIVNDLNTLFSLR